MRTQNKIAIITFPGSNCDVDCIRAFKKLFSLEIIKIRHDEKVPPKVAGIVVPGGFSFGDYVRGGALATLTPVMSYLFSHVKNGGSVIGICNGFQILTESKILPGTLLKNSSNRFVCADKTLTLGKGESLYHQHLDSSALSLPIAHSEGRYFASIEEIKKLDDNGQILFRYKDNPNGSSDNIAGIISENAKVIGMMPHPERQGLYKQSANTCGRNILKCFVESCL
jgi:phosphoribosylformylglycinamidine synthase subunit PurQ / glutaminase